MWADINGERKKVACGPCIRGHRSSKCDHKDRVLVEVRKPGRPLSSCPHPTGSCSCERVVINYTIPKTSECACPSERTQPATSSSAGTSNRVQKPRARKLTNSITPASLEKAIKASQDIENDSSSFIASTPTNPSFAPSERSVSNEASAPSSASSTPRILPSPSRKQRHSVDFQLSNVSIPSDSRPPTSSSDQVSDCCKTKPAPIQQQSGSCCKPKPEPVRQQGGSCCSNKVKEPPKAVPVKKSCCSGPSKSNQVEALVQVHPQSTAGQNPGNFPSLQQAQYYNTTYGMMSPGFNYNMSGNMGMPVPFGFHTPIYNHMAGGIQQPGPMPNVPLHNSAHHVGTHSTEHNCHCGDGCSCFGCAAHPNNATMTEYIRVMHQYMSTGGFGAMPPPTYDMPAHPHTSVSGAEAVQNMQYNTSHSSAGFHPVSVGHMPFPAHVNPVMSIPNTPVNIASPWQQGSTHISVQSPSATETQYFGPSITQEAPLSLKTESSAPSPTIVFADSPSDGKDEDASTLSPSSYFWQEIVLPGCNDATGTCQCGDGCECVGCLTHGGHNGIPLEPLETPTGTASDILRGMEISEWARHDLPEGNQDKTFSDNDPRWINPNDSTPDAFSAPPDSSALW